MNKRIGWALAALAAVTITFYGAHTFACDGKAKSATAQTANAQAKDGASCCPGMKSSASAQTADMKSGCGSATGVQNAVDSKQGSGSCCPYMSSSKSAAYACERGKSASAQMACGQSKSSAMTHAGCGTKQTSNAAWTSNLCGGKGYYGANVYAVVDGKSWAVANGQKFEVTDNSPYTQVGEARYYFADEASKVRCAEQMKSTMAELDQEAVSLATLEANVVKGEHGEKLAECPVTGTEFVVTADAPARVADGKKYYLSTDAASLLPSH